MSTENHNPPAARRWQHLLISGAFGVAAIGLLAGTAPKPRPSPKPAVAAAAAAVAKAPSYREIRERELQPPGPGPSELALQQPLPVEVSASVAAALDQRHNAVEERKRLRAYDGAPPAVPHAVQQDGLLACAACHAEGLRLGAKPIPQISHANYTLCTQCHVPKAAPLPPEAERLAQSVGDSSFVGYWAPSFGRRAWAGAPPATPHSTWMRDNCSACHGGSASVGLASSHPWRSSCVQCHAVKAGLEQMPRGAVAAIGPSVQGAELGPQPKLP